ncbi:MAG: RagB/SusD family nutrient uptake outer membrane protein [Gemmatimonadaceae bacterium]
MTIIAGVALASACQDSFAPDLNNPTVPPGGVIVNPSRSQVSQLASGLLAASRADHASYIRDLEIFGRDAYNLDNADPRWVTELLGVSPLDAGGFGGGHWLAEYRAVRSANLLLASIATATEGVFTAGEIAATEGFAKTFKALDIYHVVQSRGDAGAPVDVGQGVDDLQPIVCYDPALAEVAAILDDAAADLESAGSSGFPFELPPGFDGFDDAASFREFNRGLAARVEIYRGNFTAALSALSESFIDTTAPLDLGVYHSYSLQSGDVANLFFQNRNTYRAHPSVVDDAEAGDDRVAEKIVTGTALVSNSDPNVASDLVFSLYDGAEAPVPILQNEELILLRAQANIGAGSLAEATRDINTIRVKAGGLAPRAHASLAEVLDDLLVQKRYSLLFESGSRWIDARFYGRLDQLPLDSPDHSVHTNYPIPEDDELARGGDIACQTTP